MTPAILAVSAVTGAALGVGAWGVRTTSDLFVASRAVSPWWNAAAISGEYLSAVSFLGIAGLEMKYGASVLWLPIGFAGGYLALLLFVAAPLRRYGSYTIADFVEARLADPRLRTLAACVVLLIGGFYLVPQLKGAGLTLGEVTGAPYWIGVLIVAAIVTLNVALGGMRGIAYVQAFQYWVKVFAIALPAFVLSRTSAGCRAARRCSGATCRAPASRGSWSGSTVRARSPFRRRRASRAPGRRAAPGRGRRSTSPAATSCCRRARRSR